MRAAHAIRVQPRYFYVVKRGNNAYSDVVERAKKAIDELAINTQGQGPAEIVLAEPLGSILRRWTIEYLADRPRYPDADGNLNEFMGPQTLLAEKTGLTLRRVAGICNGEYPRVPLHQADALLTAIHHNGELAPGGRVTIHPNPNWSLERWFKYMEERGCL